MREVVLIGGFAVLTALLAQVRITLGFTPVLIGGAVKLLIAGTLTPIAWNLISRRPAGQ